MQTVTEQLRAYESLRASLPNSSSYLLQVRDTLKPLLASPQRRRTLSDVICKWWQPGDSNAPQRLECLIHDHISYQNLRFSMGEMDYHRKHELLRIVADFKLGLYDVPTRPLGKFITPLADFYGLPPLAALYQQRHLATRYETQSDYADFRDEYLVDRINGILRPNDLRIIWPFVVVFVYEGSQISIVDLYVRDRTPIDEMSNFSFEPRLGLK